MFIVPWKSRNALSQSCEALNNRMHKAQFLWLLITLVTRSYVQRGSVPPPTLRVLKAEIFACWARPRQPRGWVGGARITFCVESGLDDLLQTLLCLTSLRRSWSAENPNSHPSPAPAFWGSYSPRNILETSSHKFDLSVKAINYIIKNYSITNGWKGWFFCDLHQNQWLKCPGFLTVTGHFPTFALL